MSVAKTRYKVFSEEYIKKELSAEDDELKKLTGSGIGKGCHPDPGLGRFAAKLPLEDWMALNTAQRAAGNYLEQQTSIITLLLLNGSFNPIFTATTGAIYMVGRYMYASGIQSKAGVGRRGPGFGICMLCFMTLFVSTMLNGLRMTGVFA